MICKDIRNWPIAQNKIKQFNTKPLTKREEFAANIFIFS